jgi:dienelactone hydrolase
MATETVEYEDAGEVLEGFLAKPEGRGPFPAVLVAHAWGGRDAFADHKAMALADLGYVGFALDVYGKGKRGSDRAESQALIAPFMSDRVKLRRRLLAAVRTVAARPEVDPDKLGAIGFCFGGLCVLDLARAGAELRGVVSFHGLLTPAADVPSDTITAKVLALHGYDDPSGPPEQVISFAKEMTQAGVDWQLHAYGHTMHAFTNPQANDRSVGNVYASRADARSWESMKLFLAEAFEGAPMATQPGHRLADR